MRENRQHGSEGGEGNLPYPYHGGRIAAERHNETCCRTADIAAHASPRMVEYRNGGVRFRIDKAFAGVDPVRARNAGLDLSVAVPNEQRARQD